MNENLPKNGNAVASVPQKPVMPSPPSVPKTPMVPMKRPNSGGGVLGRKIYSKEEKAKYLEKRNKTPIGLRLLQIFTILFVLAVFVVHLAVKSDLDPHNKYLSFVGLSHNTEQKHKKLAAQNQNLTSKIEKANTKIKTLSEKLSKKEFFLHNDLINEIRNQERVEWFDRKIAGSNKVKLGIFDTFDKVIAYFSDEQDKNTLLSNKTKDKDQLQFNRLTITNINANREKVNFSVEAYNGFSKAFFLSAEFTEVINAFPFFKNGKIDNFSRGSEFETMNFTLSLDIQKEGEVDDFDRKYGEFEDWLDANFLNLTETETDSKIEVGNSQSQEKKSSRGRVRKRNTTQ